MILEKTAAVVLGAHRSGTSAMARTLSLTGLALPRTLLSPQPDNPGGFWESAPIMALNDEILASRDSDWREVFAEDEARTLSNSLAVFSGRAAELLHGEYADSPHIVLKDPRISLLAGFWRDALGEVGYRSSFPVMVREPQEVARSLARRNGCSLDRGLLMWLAAMLSAERATRGERRLFILYDDLLRDPRAVLDDVEVMQGQPLPRRTAVAELEVERWLDEGLRHHRSPERPRPRGELATLAHDAYAWFATAARGEAPPEEELQALAERLQRHRQVLSGVLAEYRLESRAAAVEASRTGAALVDTQARLAERERACGLAEARLAELEAELAAERSDGDARVEALAQTTTALHEAGAALNAATLSLEELQDQHAVALEAAWAEAAGLRRSLLEAEAAARQAGACETDVTTLSAVLAEVRAGAGALEEQLDAAGGRLREAEAELAQARAAAVEQCRRFEMERAAGAHAARLAATAACDEVRQARVEAGRLATDTERACAEALHGLETRWAEADAELQRVRSEREALQDALQAERGRADALAGQAGALRATLAYLQGRPWWRAAAFLKGVISAPADRR